MVPSVTRLPEPRVDTAQGHAAVSITTSPGPEETKFDSGGARMHRTNRLEVFAAANGGGNRAW